MRVLCWNLGVAFGRWRDEPTLHDRAWQWIAAVEPDLAFLQETLPPAWALDRWTIVLGPHRFFASALVAQDRVPLHELVVPADGPLDRFGSYLATGELRLVDGTPVLVSSVHTPARVAPAWAHPGLDPESLARMTVGVPWLNDVAFAGLRELVDGRRFVIAGDWNTSRWCDTDGVPAPDGQEFFDRASAAGWIDVSLDPDGHELKSWFGSTNPRFSQLDHVFVDAETARAARSFTIDPDPAETLGLSDHAPLLLELDLDLAAAGSP